MAKKNSLKRALIFGATSMALSASMFVGTTFAWFTDSVTSSNNIIKSGNLDVELYYQTEGQTGWTEVDSETNVFKEALWEPGHTEVVKLKTVNAGSLALKYQLGVNVASEVGSVNVYGDEFKLSEYIKYGVVNGEQTYTTRAAAINAAESAGATALSVPYSSATQKLVSKAESVVTMVVYMPSTVQNEANAKLGAAVPTINLGINLVATQVEAESDSFGPDYDASAWDYWDGTSASYDWYDPTEKALTISSAAELAGFAQIVNGTATSDVTTYASGTATKIKDSFKNKTITLTTDVDLRGWLWTPIGTSSQNGFYGTFNGNGHTIKNFSLKCSSGNYGAGFFGNLLSGAAIKNVTFEDVSADMRANIVGVAAGYLYGSATFENVHVTGSEVKAFGKVGGILGMAADPGAHTVTMKNCSVDGSIGGTYNVGGLIGLVLQGVTVNLENCDVDVKFTVKDTAYNKPYQQLAGGSWVWAYSNNSLYAAVAKNYCYYDAQENELTNGTLTKEELEVVVTTTAGLKGVIEAAVANGEKDITVDAYGANIGALSYGLSSKLVPEDTTVTIKNATVQGKSYGNGVDGTVIFENCTFTNTGAYSIHFDSGKGDVVFNNCTLQGWCSFGAAIKSVTMNNCKIEGNATYGIVRFYQDAVLNNCVINCSNAIHGDAYPDGVSAVNDNTVALVNCELVYSEYEIEDDGVIKVDGVRIATNTENAIKAMATSQDDVYMENVNEPDGVLEIAADYTGTLTLKNCKFNSIQALGNANIVIQGNVEVKATNASAISAVGKLQIKGDGTLTAIANGTGAYGIGGAEVKEVLVEGVTVKSVKGGCFGEAGTDTKYYKDAPEGGAAIGSGYNGAVITLKNVTVTEAIGGSKAAAIGANYHTGVTVNIENSTIVYAEGGVSAAAIGGSRVSNGATEAGTTVNIKNSNVTAKGGVYGAGIGSGYDTHCQSVQPLCTIFIEGSTINATGGKYAAGVGTGYHMAALAGEIKNSTVNAVSGEKFYKASYIMAMDIGFGVVDPAREGTQTASSLVYNGEEITLADGCYQVSSQEEFVNALKTGGNVVLAAGNYTMVTTVKDVTISGENDVVVELPHQKVGAQGNTIIFDGVSIKGVRDGTMHSNLFEGAKKVIYKDCAIVDRLTTYIETEFIGCTFTNTFENDYSVYCYSGKVIRFEDCTFNTNCSKAIKVYDEGNGGRTVYVTGCTFNTETANKAAVEINSTFSTYYVYIEDCEINGAYTKVWNSDAGEDVHTNVCLDGVWVKGSAPANN